MPVVKLIDNENASLWFHEESKIVHHKIHKFLPPGAFQELLTTGADCLEKHRAIKWLSDDSSNSVVRQEDAKWGNEVWAPRVIKAGFKYWAVIMPEAAVGQAQMKRFIEEYKQRGVTVKPFTSVDAAVLWLGSVG